MGNLLFLTTYFSVFVRDVNKTSGSFLISCWKSCFYVWMWNLKSNFKWPLLFSCCCWLLTSNWDRHASPSRGQWLVMITAINMSGQRKLVKLPIPSPFNFILPRKEGSQGGVVYAAFCPCNTEFCPSTDKIISYKKWLT